MDTGAQELFWNVHKQAGQDRKYRMLQDRCADLDLPLLEVLEKLSKEDQRVVMDDIQAVGALLLRLAELACIRRES